MKIVEIGTKILIPDEGWPRMLAQSYYLAVKAVQEAGVKFTDIYSTEPERVTEKGPDKITGWSQRSSTSKNQKWASESSCKEVRLLKLGEDYVAILMCGEIFNQRIRGALSRSPFNPRVVIDVAHIGHGFRVWQGMKKLAELGLSTVCTVHVQRQYSRKYCYTPDKGCLSTNIPDDFVFGPPRIELKLWSF